jgi:hypothetical protein
MNKFRSWEEVLQWVIAQQEAHPWPELGALCCDALNRAVRANGMTAEQIAAVNAAAARHHGPTGDNT